MIDIIIPVYNSLDYLGRALDSILYQKDIPKINVYIIDDGSSCDYSNILNKYNSLLNISYIKLDKNSGPGNARNVGISNSKSKYILFLDSDDIFYDSSSLASLYNLIEEKNLDYVKSNVLLELDNKLILKECENISLHGKIYKREFIQKNNILFVDRYMNEDLYFNSLLFLCDAQYINLDSITYVWCNNKDSLCRSDKNHYYEDLLSHTNTVVEIYNYYINNYDINLDRLKIFLAEELLYAYMCYTQTNEDGKSKIKSNFDNILNYYLKYDSLDNICDNIYDLEMIGYYNRHKDEFYSFIN